MKTKYSIFWAKRVFEAFQRSYPRATKLLDEKKPEASHTAIFDLSMGRSTWKKYTREVKALDKQIDFKF